MSDAPIGGNNLFRPADDRAELSVQAKVGWKPPEKIAAGERHTLLCQWCFNPFDKTVGRSGRFRESIEYEPLRKALFISDANFEPIICDGCLHSVMGSMRTERNRADDPTAIPIHLR